MTVPKLRVVHIGHTSTNGGAEYALVRMLVASPPWQFSVILPRPQNGEHDIFTGTLNPSSIHRLGPQQPAGATKSGFLRSVTLALRLIGQAIVLRCRGVLRTADVVHANSTRSALYGSLAVTATQSAFVVHLRDMITTESLGGVGFRLFTRLALRRADGVIANSAATLRSAVPYIKDGVPSVVIPSAAGIRVVRSDINVRCDVSKVGMVARIDPWKGQDLLIRAFALSSLGEHAQLVLAGGAPFGNEPYLAELVALGRELGIEDRLEFRGHVDDVPSFIDEMDILVQCSTRPEPLGQNILQYLSRGAVVIASGEGGPTEWVVDGKNGLLFEARNARALANALTRLDENVELRDELAVGALHTPEVQTDTEVARRHGSFFQLVHDRKRGLT